MPGELRLQYHQQLEEIEARVIQLFAMVSDGLAAATAAVLEGDRDVIGVLVERDAVIDTLYLDVEELVNRMLVREAPVATDLRFLLSVLRVVPELERSHDLVEHIARRGAQALQDSLSARTRGIIERMGELGVQMWRLTADGWYQRDATASAVVEQHDDEMDELHVALSAEVASGSMPTSVVMDMALVARFYERLGDHAVNISRRVAYLAGGTPTEESAAALSASGPAARDPAAG